MFRKKKIEYILERTIRKSFFKGGKTLFSEIEGCKKKFVEVRKKLP